MDYFGVYHQDYRQRTGGICDAPCTSKGRMMLCAYRTASEGGLIAMTRGRMRNRAALAARLAKAPAPAAPAPAAVSVDYVREVERELESALGRKVHLVDGRKKGRIELEFYGPEDREKLIENLRLFSSLRRNK